MADTNVRVVVDAVDRASNVLKGIGSNIERTLGKQTQANIAGVGTAASSAMGGFAQMALGIGAAGLAITAVSAGLERVGSVLNGTIQASALMERSMMGLSQVANAFAQDANRAEQAAKALAQDGLMTVQESAEGLKNLLATGFSLDESIRLMNTFKDASAANRQGTLGFGEAIVGATIGIKNQNSILVDNVGISKNLSVILKEQGLSVTDLQNVTSDASVRQRLYNGLLQEGAIFSGAAGQAANTLGGSLSQVSTASFNLSVAIGDVLSPAVSAIAEVLVGAMGGAADTVAGKMQGLAEFLLSLVTAFRIMGATAMGVLSLFSGDVLMEAVQGNFTKVNEAVAKTSGNITGIISGHYNRVGSIAEKTADRQKKAAGGAADTAVKKQSEASEKIQKQMQRETETYERELRKRNESFQERLDDLVRSHIDKKNSLMRDLAEENEDFNRQMGDRADDFKEKMEEMVDAHAEKVESITEQIDDENASYQEKLEERVADFNASMEEFTASHESKVIRLQRQMDKEKRAGDELNNAKFLDLKEELDEENAEYDRQVSIRNLQHEQELAKEKEKHDKKLIDLQEQLSKEDLAYQTSRQKQITDEELQTTRLQEEHAKRGAALQDSINKENEVLNKHQSEVAAVKDKVVDDDITRLQKQHVRENEEALVQHNQKMKDLLEQGNKQGGNYGAGLNAGLAPKLDEYNKKVVEATRKATEDFVRQHMEAGEKAGGNLISNFFKGAANVAKSIGAATGKAASAVAGFVSGGISDILKYFGVKQAGGVVPGPIGEAVPILAHGGEYVTTQGMTPKGTPTGAGAGGGATFNVYVGLYAGTESEKRNIAKQLYASLLQLAESQHKTVAEMMGG